MTPEDKEFARTCLERGWLSIEQVEELKRVVEERKVPFREVAVAYGVVREKPPAPAPPAYAVVLIGVLALFVLGSIATLAVGLREMRARDVENARRRAELERVRGREAEPDRTPLAIEAERRLNGSREALRFVEQNFRTLPEAERVTRLEESLAGFDSYLEFRPDCASVYCDRARARDFLGRLPAALADYEKAMVLDPQLARVVEPRAAQLREVLGPK